MWLVGEVVGGLTQPGAGWLTGAPGAVLVYVAGAAALLLPWSRWRDGSVQRLARSFVGLWLLLAAALQILPWEGFWSGSALSAPFVEGAVRPSRRLFRAPIASLARVSGSHPGWVNGCLLVALLVVGGGLVLRRGSDG